MRQVGHLAHFYFTEVRMKIETFPGYQLITYDDGTYGYVMADGKSKQGYKSKQGAKNAAKKLATALQVMPHALTQIEKQLADELSKLYGDAAKYLVDKATNFVSKYETGTQWDTEALNALIKQCTSQIAKTNADAVAAINGYAPVVAAEQANFAEYAIEDGTTLNPSFTLLNQDTVIRLLKDSPDVLPKAKAKIDKNKRWNTPKLRNALTRAIVQGDSIPKLSKELEQICGSNKAISVRNARTMMTGARNAGSMVAYRRAESEGMHIQKQWMAALDERTRTSHRHLDGEIKPLNEKFSNGLDHPGDTHGRPEEVYNCRCTTVPIVNDQMYEGERASKLKDMSYEEWKNAQPKPKTKSKTKKKKAEKQAAQPKQVTAIPKNKADLINALESARQEAINDASKMPEYRAAVKELSENVPFGEFFENELEKKYIVGLKDALDKARETHPEFVGMYESWQSEFSFTTSRKKGAYYAPFDRKVHITAKKAAEGGNIGTPYQTFFHELGHLIDNKAVSPTYADNLISAKLTDLIKADWDNYREKLMTELNLQGKRKAYKNAKAVERLIEIAKGGGKSIDLTVWGDVSDMIEGCTGIRYPLGAGHGAAYHKEAGITATEFFAEACSAAIVNPASFEKIKMIFPNALSELVKIVKELAG